VFEHSVRNVWCDAEQSSGLRRGEPQSRHVDELSANPQRERGQVVDGRGSTTRSVRPRGFY
jgi:hypothetical protein